MEKLENKLGRFLKLKPKGRPKKRTGIIGVCPVLFLCQEVSQMEYSGPERRRNKRIEQPFMARVQVYQKEVKSRESPGWDIVTIRDLSASGASFNYTEKITLGTVLEFNITLPFTVGPARCLGGVCRVDENPSDRIGIRKTPVYGIATHFIEIESDKKEAINRFAEEFCSKKEGKVEK